MAAQAMMMSGLHTHGKDHGQSQQDWNASLYAAQQRARRGPTPEVFHVKHIDNSRLKTEADPSRAREIRNFVVAMTMLFVLVMIYVGQHFESIKYGYQIEAQKQSLEELSEQNRKLRLTEAQMTAPLRLDSLAGNYGMDAPLPSQLVRTDAGSKPTAPVLAKAVLPAALDAGR